MQQFQGSFCYLQGQGFQKCWLDPLSDQAQYIVQLWLTSETLALIPAVDLNIKMEVMAYAALETL